MYKYNTKINGCLMTTLSIVQTNTGIVRSVDCAYQLMASYFFLFNLSASNVECVKLLLSSGADYNRRDKHGR